MAYFTKFPVVKYPLGVGSVVRNVYVRNLLRRIGLSDDLKSSAGAFLEYDIKDGERPEHIADRVYGDPSYYWVLLLTNEIIDPYYDWYRSAYSLQDYIQKKYNHYSAFVATAGNFFYSASLTEGATITQGYSSFGVLEYHPEFCRILTDKALSVGLATITTTGGTQLAVDVHRIDDSYLSVHHFEISRPVGICGANEEFVVDPLSQQTSNYEVLGGFVGSTSDVYPTDSNGKNYSPTGIVDFWETFIGRYMGVSGDKLNEYAISNHLYENDLNERKRTIKVLHPRYLQIAVKELESLLGR